MERLYKYVHPITNKHSPMISKETYDTIMKNAEVSPLCSFVIIIIMFHILWFLSLSTQRLNSAIIYDRDFNYTYFGFKTLERSYLLKIDGKGEVYK